MSRLSLLKVYLNLAGSLLFLYWPLSHWLYPEWYHRLLGFSGYDLPLVRVIGTLSLLPILSLFMVAHAPLQNRDMLVALLITSGLMAGTYIFLVANGSFPWGEIFNVILLLGNSVILGLLYPWQAASRQITIQNGKQSVD